MRDVVAPVEKVRVGFVGMRSMPAVDIDHAIAAIDFDDGRDESDDVRADVLDVGRVIDGETVGELHQRRGRAGLRGVDGAGDVVDGRGLSDERRGFGIVHVEGARIGELREARIVLLLVLRAAIHPRWRPRSSRGPLRCGQW